MRTHLIAWALCIVFGLSAVTLWVPNTIMRDAVLAEIRFARSVMDNASVNRIITENNETLADYDAWVSNLLHDADSSFAAIGKVFRLILHSLSGAIYLALLRLKLASLWLWPSLLIVVAACWDAWNVRAVKLYSFGYTDPKIFNAGAHFTILQLGAPTVYLFIPVPIPPILLLAVCAGLALSLWLTISNYQRMG